MLPRTENDHETVAMDMASRDNQKMSGTSGGDRRQSATLVSLLGEDSIRLDETATDRDDAIRRVGAVLVNSGAVDPSYVDAMLKREASVSTWVGENFAFPHATLAGKDAVRRDAIAVVRFPAGVDWGGHDVRVAVGIAARGRGHIALLSRLATVLLDPGAALALREASTPEMVYAVLQADGDR